MRAVAFGALAMTCVTVLEAQEVVTRLTTSGARNGNPSWSADGTRLVFVSNREDGWQVWSAAADGSDLRRHTQEAEPVGWPSWTEGGSAIFFYGQRDGAYRLLRLTLETGEVTRLDDSELIAFRPILSPSGSLLLFDAVDPDGRGDHDIYVRDLESGALRRLTSDPGYDSDARWSPDGREIVFHSDRGADRFHTQVYVMSSDGGTPRRLTEGPATNSYPSWSPNGRCIAYASEAEGNRDIWVVGSSGEDPVPLTWHDGFDSEPVWTRDGQLLFTTDRFGGVELAFLELSEQLARRCEAR